MVVCKVYLIALLLTILNIALVANTVVELLFPKGFSITVTNRPEINNVQFEVDVSRHNRKLTVANYSKKVRSSFMNKWVFAKRTIVLNVGDVITYKILVNGDVSESGSCEITELPRVGALNRHGWIYNYDIDITDTNCNRGVGFVSQSATSTQQSATSIQESATSVQQSATSVQQSATSIQQSAISVQQSAASLQHSATSVPQSATSAPPNDNTREKLDKCEEAIFNSSLTLLSLQIEVEELRNITQQFNEFEEKYPFAKQLTLSGRIPPDGDAVATVRFMIREKLDLSPTITTAVRESTYSIRFTVSTVIEKFEVLETAKYMLATTKIEIS